jgi:hypothetical protein
LASAGGNISTLDFPPRKPRLRAEHAMQAKKKDGPKPSFCAAADCAAVLSD